MAFNRLKDKLGGYGALVMFSHTVFSLPFGLLSMLWAAQGLPPVRVAVLILLALVCARNGANAFNRIADRAIDAKNPRTANRPIQTGRVKTGEAWGITVLCFAVLSVCAWYLNPLCLMLLPFAIAIFVFYSYSKRVTWLCHFILGLACGGAPVGAWVAVTGELALTPFALGGAVCFWVAGFDILYATQDIEFDRAERLHAVPARFGLRGALWIARGSHVAAVGCLLVVSLLMPQGWLYLAGVLAVMSLLAIEHLSMRPGARVRMNFIVYHMNQIVSVTFFLFALADFLFVKEKIVWILLPWV